MKVILYSTHCPKCNGLKKRLQSDNVKFEEVNDVNIMIKKGFMSAPVLEVDGIIMDYSKATKWLNER